MPSPFEPSPFSSSPLSPTPDQLSQVENTLTELAVAAQKLNELSDQLTKYVRGIEEKINQLGLGISASTPIEMWTSEDGMQSNGWKLSYGKSGRKWGLLVEYFEENINYPPDDEYESWAFAESPREQRIRAVQKIPDLLGALLQKSSEVASKIVHSVDYAKEISSTISSTSLKGKR